MGRSLALHGEIPEPASRPRLAILAKGFRPFFVLAAAYAVAIVPLWLASIAGLVGPSTYLDPASWHAHEMVFGFTVAVIAGFLLTAVGNWTQRETVIGMPLLLLSALWLAGRIAMLYAGQLPRGVAAIADLAFLPLLIIALARPLVAAKNRRNFVMLAILGALFLSNVVVHLNALGIWHAADGRRACLVAIDVVLIVISIIAGRVFPMFTRNATGVSSIRSIPALDVVTVGGMTALALADAFLADSKAGSLVAGVVGLAAIARARHWGARHSLREPLLWILHAGYAWLALGLLLRTVAGFVPALPSSLATHALTIGAVGSLTLGMMARVSLGHTGRALTAPSAMSWAFAAILAASATRVIVPLFVPSWYFGSLLLSGAFWTFAFFVFLVVYVPILATPRRDGKPG